jgi:hypothetical protein
VRFRGILVLLVAAAAVGIAPAPASAELTVKVKIRKAVSEYGSDIYFGVSSDSDCLDCGGTLVLVRNGQEVRREEFAAYDTPSYRYNCKRTGLYAWSVTIDAGPSRFNKDEQVPAESATGTFRIGRCTKRTGRRISRATAQREAAELFENEFVSQNRCTPVNTPKNGRSSLWQCWVRRNNTYRECLTDVGVYSYKQILFGDYKGRTYASDDGSRCRDF